MGLFTKKKEEIKPELPPLKFPRFSKEAQPPVYEQEISPSEAASIKQSVSQNSERSEDLEIPIRRPIIRKSTSPPKATHLEHTSKDLQKRGQTLFVKMERYKEAIVKMDSIKDKIIEAESILKKLDELKQKEEQDLTKWHQDLEIIKSKILSVDKSLFES